jgi:glucose-6-phosphate isomerase, archaeal
VLLDLKPQTGLPVRIETESCEFFFGSGLNVPLLRTRTLHELDSVWANQTDGADKLIYRYTAPLWLSHEAEVWEDAGIGYGIVFFTPGVYGGEYVKSSGQYHAILQGQSAATPEIYTVLVGEGHFMLQRATPPYEEVTDPVMVIAQEGETFVVPPDYGHLQINPTDGPLVFSYTVKNPLTSNYEPYRHLRGAMYYEMADTTERFVFNPRYNRRAPLRIVEASTLRQLPFLENIVDYAEIRRCLPKLGFLVRPQDFPPDAYL